MRRLTALLAALLLLAFTGCAATRHSLRVHQAQRRPMKRKQIFKSKALSARIRERVHRGRVHRRYKAHHHSECPLPRRAGKQYRAERSFGRHHRFAEPLENVYLVSTSAMDPILKLDARSAVTLSGTSAENWYLPEAKEAMENGEISYAGKYSAPDYERIVSANCGLAIENTNDLPHAGSERAA